MQTLFTNVRPIDGPCIEPKEGFRPGTRLPPYEVGFLVAGGGMGDYICWTQAFRYIAHQFPWIRGSIIAPIFFHEFLRIFINEETAPGWRLISYEDADRDLPDGCIVKGRTNTGQSEINATGAHLIDCGFAYFAAETPPPPAWNYYPQFESEDLEPYFPPDFDRKRPYAVITPNALKDIRFVPGASWTPILQHLRGLGIQPILLGRSDYLAGVTKMRAIKDDTLRKDLAEDWRNRTSILQAAAILSEARLVLGLDNGLLHLAGCTSAPLIFGYNVASPLHRRPRRPTGRIEDVFLSPNELGCTFCQSRIHMFLGFDWKACFYQDRACIGMLFADGARRWTDAIDRIISGT